jgi:hypothetical protein
LSGKIFEEVALADVGGKYDNEKIRLEASLFIFKEFV